MNTEFGLVLPAGPQRTDVDAWLDDLDAHIPELAGTFASLWMTDHFCRGEIPVFEAWTVMAFAAARWPQFAIGPMVLGQSYRNPALLAKMAATLHSLSQGRFIMAIGAGWKEDEYHAYGYPFPRASTRIEQLGEALEIMRRMWTKPGPVTYRGKHYQIVDAYCEPRPDPLPTLIVGGGGNKTMKLAVEYADWWNLPDADATQCGERVPVLHRLCAEAGRDPASLRITWFGRLAVADSLAAAEALSNGRWTQENAIVGTPEQVVDQIEAFKATGVTYFMVEVLGLTDPATRALVVEQVLPRVR